MTRMLVLMVACLIGVGEAKSVSAAASTPNIIYILADDLGYADLSCNGQKRFTTPNLDRMAAEGINFTDHHSGSTVCAPSRFTLMMGLHIGHAHKPGQTDRTVLYDLEKDVGETTDLSTQHPEKLAEMVEILDRHVLPGKRMKK